MLSTTQTESAHLEPLEIPGAALARGEHHYALRLDAPFQFLSSAPLGEGFINSKWVLSLEVKPNADIPCPERYVRERATAFGMPESGPIIGLLTAVRHADLQVCVRSESGVTVATLATVGVSNASSPLQKDVVHFGQPGPSIVTGPAAGTINLVVLLDADLSPGALVRASTIATEAKTLALAEAGITTRNGSPATGTSTDATVVGHSGTVPHFDYAGSPTLAGWLVAATAHQAVSRGIRAYNARKSTEGGRNRFPSRC